MTLNKLKPIWILIVLTMILLSVSLVEPPLASLTAEDWNSYHNEEFGFAFKYPHGYILSERPAAGKAIGSAVVDRRDETGEIAGQNVQVTLPPLKDLGVYPGARGLRDYAVPQYFNGIYTVIIDSNQETVINGFRVLRQEYRAGELINGELRREGFGSTLDGLRYVFFDGENSYVILKGSRSSAQLLDSIAPTFQFFQK